MHSDSVVGPGRARSRPYRAREQGRGAVHRARTGRLTEGGRDKLRPRMRLFPTPFVGGEGPSGHDSTSFRRPLQTSSTAASSRPSSSRQPAQQSAAVLGKGPVVLQADPVGGGGQVRAVSPGVRMRTASCLRARRSRMGTEMGFSEWTTWHASRRKPARRGARVSSAQACGRQWWKVKAGRPCPGRSTRRHSADLPLNRSPERPAAGRSGRATAAPSTSYPHRGDERPAAVMPGRTRPPPPGRSPEGRRRPCAGGGCPRPAGGRPPRTLFRRGYRCAPGPRPWGRS